MHTVRSQVNRLSVAVMCSLYLASAMTTQAQQDRSTVVVTDSKGIVCNVSDFTFVDAGEEIRLKIPTITYECGKFQGKPMPKGIKRIIPLDSIKTIKVIKPSDYLSLAVVQITRVSGTTSTVSCSNFSLKGKQDLGELGSGDFSIESEMKEITFTWNKDIATTVQGPWPVSGQSTEQSYSGKVDIDGQSLLLGKMAIYYRTSDSGCSIHSICGFGCNYRYHNSWGNIASGLKINKNNTDIDLDFAKVSQVAFTNYPEVVITLRTGTKTDCNLLLPGDGQGVLAHDSEGWIYIPRELIRSIEFE